MKIINITVSEYISRIKKRINQVWKKIQTAPVDSKSLEYDKKFLIELNHLADVLDRMVDEK